MFKSYEIFLESVINRDKSKEIFNYRGLVNGAWRPLILKAQKFQNINFDLENNDTLGEKKTFYVAKNLRKDQHVKYEFNAELCCAGVDWEYPVMYFKVEFTHDYGIVSNKNVIQYIFDVKNDEHNEISSKCYVLIPGIEDGNHLVKTENGYTAYTEDYIVDENIKSTDLKITKEDKHKAWSWLEKLLNDLVEERHKMLDEKIEPNITDVEPQN